MVDDPDTGHGSVTSPFFFSPIIAVRNDVTLHLVKMRKYQKNKLTKKLNQKKLFFSQLMSILIN